MIFDKLERLSQYKGLNANLDRLIDFTLSQSLYDLKQGKYEIDGENCWLNSNVALLVDGNTLYERHLAYIDLQIPLDEGEIIMVKPVEDMEWPALTHRAKKTEISEKTGKIKRKKRFGKSVGNKAPATLIGLLDLKLKSRGLAGVIRVDTRVRASQYNHLSDDYRKKELRDRWNDMPDGRHIQRDLYSAFLLQHMNEKQDGFDKAALHRDYGQFTERHNQCIEELRTAPKTLASMGIVRRAG